MIQREDLHGMIFIAGDKKYLITKIIGDKECIKHTDEVFMKNIDEGKEFGGNNVGNTLKNLNRNEWKVVEQQSLEPLLFN